MGLKITDKDSGFNILKKNIEQAKPVAVIVGITKDSPRSQFRFANAQEFRPETAGTLLRGPVDNKKAEIQRRLFKIASAAIISGLDPKAELLRLGNDIKADMGQATDPPPQLKNAIIVKIDNDT